MSTPTRQRIVEAGADLLRHKGYAATGVKEIVANAQAPFGSLYHHVPGGKEQLGEEVIRFGGAEYGKLGPLIFDAAPDVVTGVRMFFDGAADNLQATEWLAGCPIATVALEVANTSEPLRIATADVFTSWIDGLAPRFADAGLPADRAREIAVAFIAALEGAFVLSQSWRDTSPLRIAGQTVARELQAALAEAGAAAA
jgi:AcrR family transcriptional regulator